MGGTLITGVSGALAGIVAGHLAEEGTELIGADVRALPMGRPFPGEFYRVRRYAQRKMDEVFRAHRPDTLIHMGRIRTSALKSLSHRYNQNVIGTKHLLELCVRYDVKRVVVLSTYHVYGAHQHNHGLIREDHPLRASQIFPELADAVELDHSATSFLWRYRRVGTVVLRPANMIGPSLNNLMSRLLRSKRCPKLLGYDPMMQFLHEQDAARAILAAARSDTWGVFNVAGEGAVPYSHAVELAGATNVSVPHVLAYPLVGSLQRWRLLWPKHLMDYFRYPTVIDDRAFRGELGWAPEQTVVETLTSLAALRAQPRLMPGPLGA